MKTELQISKRTLTFKKDHLQVSYKRGAMRNFVKINQVRALIEIKLQGCSQ